ncbi:hypothetical protein E2C01_051994 [Portunus trituberculatus]|uniref:Uncharacterized protein n=1 Tax=Portunus trituberculatus TaxID=210409 RepID=A0A5B7GGD7_PORTR|nr:hypothetical protein [Portunus trituberculatus]
MYANSNTIEKILQAVTEAVFAVVEARLQQQHRVLVATLFSLARLNMFSEKEDYVKAFLIPLNLDETWLWGEIIPPKKEKKAKVDEEEEDEGKEEDKKEQDMEEGKDEEKEKNLEEKEDRSEDEDPEKKKCETVEEHQDQPNEDFPSWIPSECNIKVCFVVCLTGTQSR